MRLAAFWACWFFDAGAVIVAGNAVGSRTRRYYSGILVGPVRWFGLATHHSIDEPCGETQCNECKEDAGACGQAICKDDQSDDRGECDKVFDPGGGDAFGRA